LKTMPAVTLVLAVLAGPASAQPATDASDIVARITGTALTQPAPTAFLERLTDTIGGRVTGSPQSKATAELLLETLRQAQLADVHAEEWTLASRWQRLRAVGSIRQPIERPILLQSFGWVPGTTGPIEAPLVDVGTAGPDVPLERVKGAIVLANFKALAGEKAYVIRAQLAPKLAVAGALALLVPSDKPDRLLDIGCFGNYPKGMLPMLSIAQDDALLLRRLLAKGPVRLGLDVENVLDLTQYKERNVAAEIHGRTLPGEVVLLGAHFDSWDTGQGANDNGSGVAALVEAARLLRQSGARPRRTIRFVFFSGEEQALLGSRAYVEAHAEELDRVRAVLVIDSGISRGQTPHGFELQGRTDLEPALKRLLAPLAPLGASGVKQDPSFDTDHAFFSAAGVPAFPLWVDEASYDVHHHSIADTFERVDPQLLALDSAVMAIAAYLIADAEEPIGPRLSPAEAEELLRKTGMASSYRLLTGRDLR